MVYMTASLYWFRLVFKICLVSLILYEYEFRSNIIFVKGTIDSTDVFPCISFIDVRMACHAFLTNELLRGKG